MLRRVALVKTDVSEELSAVTYLVTLMLEAPSSSETSVLTRVTRRNIPEEAFFKYIPAPFCKLRQNLMFIFATR
jgi:hypothetical protein